MGNMVAHLKATTSMVTTYFHMNLIVVIFIKQEHVIPKQNNIKMSKWWKLS